MGWTDTQGVTVACGGALRRFQGTWPLGSGLGVSTIGAGVLAVAVLTGALVATGGAGEKQGLGVELIPAKCWRIRLYKLSRLL